MSLGTEAMALDRMRTPIGTALLVVDGEGYLRAFDWADYEDRHIRLLRRFNGDVTLSPGEAPLDLRRSVEAYFDGEPAALADVAWRSGGTAFQQSCWAALCAIPPGETSTYGMQARRVGRPSAVRAVGTANGCNPVGVVVPCHRVIGFDGSLIGYGGGLWRKRWLLRHEGVPFFQDGRAAFDFAADLDRAMASSGEGPRGAVEGGIVLNR